MSHGVNNPLDGLLVGLRSLDHGGGTTRWWLSNEVALGKVSGGVFGADESDG